MVSDSEMPLEASKTGRDIKPAQTRCEVSVGATSSYSVSESHSRSWVQVRSVVAVGGCASYSMSMSHCVYDLHTLSAYAVNSWAMYSEALQAEISLHTAEL